MRRALFVAIILLFTMAGPVAAAAPNDTVAGATDVSVGDTVNEDTSAADTTDATETALNEFCGAPAVEHGVWFEITPSADVTAKFDVVDSNYSAGIMIFEDPPTADGLLNCGPGIIIQGLAAGVTYDVLVFGDGGSAATGGAMVLHVLEAAPAPDISVTINRRGTADKQGNAHISGTVTCTSTDGSGILFDVFGDMTQKVGRIRIHGFFDTFLEVPCDGTTNAWTAVVVGDNGVFAGGKAVTVAIGFGCTDECSEGFAQATIQLSKGK
jgi:hypothetical protein